MGVGLQTGACCAIRCMRSDEIRCTQSDAIRCMGSDAVALCTKKRSVQCDLCGKQPFREMATPDQTYATSTLFLDNLHFEELVK